MEAMATGIRHGESRVGEVWSERIARRGRGHVQSREDDELSDGVLSRERALRRHGRRCQDQARDFRSIIPVSLFDNSSFAACTEYEIVRGQSYDVHDDC